MTTLKEQQAQEEEAEAKADFMRGFEGPDPEGAWRAAQAVEAVEKRGDRRPDVNKEALTRVGDVLKSAIATVARFRSGGPLTDDERDDLIKTVMAETTDIPAGARAELEEEVTRRIDSVRKTGDIAEAHQAARAASFRIASGMPRTYEAPPRTSSEELSDILSRIPRA